MRRLAILCGLLLLSGCGPERARIRAVDLAGLDAAIAAHRGHPLLVNLWAMWCKPCVEELPDLMRAAQDLRRVGGDVIAVSIDLAAPNTERDAVLKRLPSFCAQVGLHGEVLLYDDFDVLPLMKHFGLPGSVPITLAIDRNGKVVDRLEDKSSYEDFVDLMKSITKE